MLVNYRLNDAEGFRQQVYPRWSQLNLIKREMQLITQKFLTEIN